MRQIQIQATILGRNSNKIRLKQKTNKSGGYSIKFEVLKKTS